MPARAAMVEKAEATAKSSKSPLRGGSRGPQMDDDSSPESASGSPKDVDRLLRRLDAHPTLPAMAASKVPILGPPTPVADETRGDREAVADLVVTPARIYVTVELPGASRDTMEVTSTDYRLTVHAIGADGRVFHREIELPHAVMPDAVTATYRNGVLDVTLPRLQGHRVRVRRQD